MKVNAFLVFSALHVGLSLSLPTETAGDSIVERQQQVFQDNNGLLIAKGETAPEHLYPFEVSLQQLNPQQAWSHRCAGSIIGRNKIITTASCVDKFFNGNLSEYRAVAGINRIEGQENQAQFRSFIDGYTHPKYSKYTKDYDYFVAYVSIPFDFENDDSIVRPVELPAKTEEPKGSCVIAGWGGTGGEEMSVELLHVNLTIVPVEACKEMYGKIGYLVTPRMLCAGNDGNGICEGDFGGPLLCNMTLVGIASWTEGSCGSEYPGVFSYVSKAIEWIKLV